MPVVVPTGVEIKQANGALSVKGPKGTLELVVHPDMSVVIDESELRVERPSDVKEHRALHGLTRSLIANMVAGVTEGFAKTLEIVGVGYRADIKGSGITLNLGYSHTIEYQPLDGVRLECPNQTTIVVSGIDKQKVGQTAADIRACRPPEHYKGKGIRYQGEYVRRKAGKTAGV
jgi:large subunit ribosomal protein L6